MLKQIGIGGVIGVIGGLFGLIVGFLSVLGTGWIEATIYLAGSVGFIWVFWHFMFGPLYRSEKILTTGEEAMATIVRIRENGSSLKLGGGIPRAGVDVTLEVKPNHLPAYQATVATFVSMFELSSFQIGSTLRVKFDPRRPERVAIVNHTGWE